MGFPKDQEQTFFTIKKQAIAICKHLKKEILQRYLPLVKAEAGLVVSGTAMHFPTLSYLVKP